MYKLQANYEKKKKKMITIKEERRIYTVDPLVNGSETPLVAATDKHPRFDIYIYT